jgi:hypothetical protein
VSTQLKKKIELEKHIEARFLRRLKERWPTAQHRKMNGYGHRSWPDRLVLLPHGVALFIEFKRPGGALSPGQEHLINELRLEGHRVKVCDDAEQAIILCEAEVLRAKRKKV